MKKLVNYCSIIFLLLVATSQVKAQSVDVVIRENGTERKESIDLPKSMTYPLDSLLNDWKAKNYIDLGKDCSTAEINPLFSDSVYIDRLSRIPAIMEMPYNDIIRKFIDMYAGRCWSLPLLWPWASCWAAWWRWCVWPTTSSAPAAATRCWGSLTPCARGTPP